MKPPGTVVINVQPNSDLQGATFVREVTLSPDGEVQYSRIIVSGPTSESKTVTIPIAYELKLTDEDHISKLNEQLKKAEPLEVSLMFDFDGTSKTKLYWMLADARAKDKDVKYSVVLECWYSRNGRYVLSVEDRTLEISDY